MDQALYTEVKTDPLARGYAGMTAQQVADSLNTADRTRYRVLTAADLNAWAAGGPMMKIAAAKDNGLLGGEQRSLAWAAWRLLDRDSASVDLNSAEYSGFLAALVTAGIISADDQTALQDRATETVSRAQEIGARAPVKPGWIEQVRAAP